MSGDVQNLSDERENDGHGTAHRAHLLTSAPARRRARGTARVPRTSPTSVLADGQELHPVGEARRALARARPTGVNRLRRRPDRHSVTSMRAGRVSPGSGHVERLGARASSEVPSARRSGWEKLAAAVLRGRIAERHPRRRRAEAAIPGRAGDVARDGAAAHARQHDRAAAQSEQDGDAQARHSRARPRCGTMHEDAAAVGDRRAGSSTRSAGSASASTAPGNSPISVVTPARPIMAAAQRQPGLVAPRRRAASAGGRGRRRRPAGRRRRRRVPRQAPSAAATTQTST